VIRTVFIIAVLAASCAQAQESSDWVTVAARVNGVPIYVGQVEQQVQLVLRGRQAERAALRAMQAQAIEQLIGRRLILEMLAERKQAANEQEIDLEIERIRKRLAVTGATLEDHLKQTNQSLDALRTNLAWQLSWQRYLDQYLASENVKKFYELRKRQFDGSQARVAHILLKVDQLSDADQVAAAVEKAAEIRQKIAAEELTFDAAAKQFSQSPTAESGGHLGFIERRGSMPEAFAKAAFDLEPGRLSQPVVTPFGVHLIQLLEIKPGQREWFEVEGEVRLAATQYLFDWIVERRRPGAKIEYTGALPHFKPGTREVVQ
jgi:peptidyl-prolyl cis-trans isomerase C